MQQKVRSEFNEGKEERRTIVMKDRPVWDLRSERIDINFDRFAAGAVVGASDANRGYVLCWIGHT
jgi:hypothetical protein